MNEKRLAQPIPAPQVKASYGRLASQTQPGQTAVSGGNGASSTKLSPLAIVALVTVVLAGAGVGIYFATKSSSSDPTPPPTPATTVAPTPPIPAPPTPAPTPRHAGLPAIGTKYYGYWYSYYCDRGSVEWCITPPPPPRPGAKTYPTCVNQTGLHTAPGNNMKGLMGVEDLVSYVNSELNETSPFYDYSELTVTGTLGIGSPLSGGNKAHNLVPPVYTDLYTLNDLLCAKSTSVRSAGVTSNGTAYNILNIGGWGSQPDGTPIHWNVTDVELNDTQITHIVKYLHDNNYTGISFDIEGLSEDGTWNSTDIGSAAHKLSVTCGKIQAKGYMVWIVIPAFNVQTGNGGPLKIVSWDNVSVVQLMVYGVGLDSMWAGDPSRAPVTPDQVSAVVNGFIDDGANKSQIMLSYSYNTGGYTSNKAQDAQDQKDHLIGMINGPGKNATAGTMVWCKGNGRMFSWATSKWGTCKGVTEPISDTAGILEGRPPYGQQPYGQPPYGQVGRL